MAKKINTLAGVFKATGVTPETDPVLSLPDHEAFKGCKAKRIIELIAEALNEGVKMDVANTSQWKYFPYFLVTPDASRPSGFRLSCHDCVYDSSGAYLGSRLGFKDRATAEYAGKTFIEQYEEYHRYC